MASEEVCLLRCDWCNEEFEDKYVLTKHLHTHKTRLDKNIKKCPLCSVHIYEYEKHLKQAHDIHIKSECLMFTTISEFSEWKEKVEQETKSRYVQRGGSRRNRDGSRSTYYYCHRVGNYTPKGKGIRALKASGSNKINADCPASMKVTDDQCVTVRFKSTHVGHSCDIGRMVLTKQEKDKLAAQINMKIPLEDILDETRNSLEENNMQRIHLATKQDLWNIIAQYSLDNEYPVSNDAKAVDMWVEHMKATTNMIRLYKSQGMLSSDAPELKPEDFCLIFANNVQIDVLKQFGNGAVCIDGTRSLTGYEFQLYTMLVLDDMRTEFPCAFMFSNREDSVVMELFFRTIKTCLGNSLCPKYFMSDMEETFYSAWRAVFPDNETQEMYCSWHVDRAWQKNLNKVKTEEKKVEVYKKIKVLMMETDRSAFNLMSNNLMSELYGDDLTKHFASYFEKFVLEPSKWAYCYRVLPKINTNMDIEVFHRHLRHIYLAGRKVKKMIKSIHALLKFTRDRIFQRLIGMCKCSVMKQPSSLRKRHMISLNLRWDSVHKLSEDEWNVVYGTELYTVSVLNKECTCKLRCAPCRACLHSFTCTCTDSAVLWNMCKHIHLVCQAYKPVVACPQNEELEIDNEEIEIDNEELEVGNEEIEIANEEIEIDHEEIEIDHEEIEIDNEEAEIDNGEPEIDNEIEIDHEEIEIDNEEPEIDNEEPEIDQEVPETDNEEPEIDHEVIEIDHEEPEIADEEIEIDYEEPEIDNEIERDHEESEIDNEEIEIYNEEPEIDNEELEIDNEEPEIDDEEIEIDNEEPEIDNEDLEIDNEEPEIDNEEIEIDNEEPEIDNEEPEIHNEEPEIHNEEPEIDNEEPLPVENAEFLAKDLSKKRKADEFELRKKCEAERLMKIIDCVKTETMLSTLQKLTTEFERMVKNSEQTQEHTTDVICQAETSQEPAKKKICPQKYVMFYSTKKKPVILKCPIIKVLPVSRTVISGFAPVTQ